MILRNCCKIYFFKSNNLLGFYLQRRCCFSLLLKIFFHCLLPFSFYFQICFQLTPKMTRVFKITQLLFMFSHQNYVRNYPFTDSIPLQIFWQHFLHIFCKHYLHINCSIKAFSLKRFLDSVIWAEAFAKKVTEHWNKITILWWLFFAWGTCRRWNISIWLKQSHDGCSSSCQRRLWYEVNLVSFQGLVKLLSSFAQENESFCFHFKTKHQFHNM